ncbi:hypothetical protein BI364_08915 [Acidihalobacter yilgarnensis]|uniref:DUF3291 domain-containing protein n=1 Tax=Acidihalobacter yilgarnensis TaxID=2819280 RepID=A0A1D8INM4_9GAMM|nr:DUF3291 domain-containing protein [Acidihalobacter yilgarnensis]AOU98067.1 hypothetical protein BI364_08915 [Acidihalobacter yilgarnensis]
MTTHILAQLNVARMKTPLDAPEMTDFVANLDRINTLAEQSPGFVWRLQTEGGDATALRPLGDQMLINLSLWVDVGALKDFVYRSAHTEIMRRRRDWFESMEAAYMVLWWVPQGHRPNVAEAVERLGLLREQGISAEAFTFREIFEPPSVAGD